MTDEDEAFEEISRSQRIGFAMTKEQILQIIKLLSAVESWSYADKRQMPEYLYERIDEAMKLLEQEVLKSHKKH